MNALEAHRVTAMGKLFVPSDIVTFAFMAVDHSVSDGKKCEPIIFSYRRDILGMKQA